VYEILFQIVSKSFLEDGNVCYIHSQTTLRLLTTNTGPKWIVSLCKDPELMPKPNAIAKSLREPLPKVFPAFLLATGDHPLRPPQRRDAGADRPPATEPDQAAGGNLLPNSVGVHRRRVDTRGVTLCHKRIGLPHDPGIPTNTMLRHINVELLT
jgi:hypothetical protein